MLAVARRGADFELDVTAPDAAERVLRGLPARRLDVLVNNAGTSRGAPARGADRGRLAGQWELNVMAPMRLMRAPRPRWPRRGGGRIVNVASSSGKRPSRRQRGLLGDEGGAAGAVALFADTWSGQGRAGQRGRARARSRASCGPAPGGSPSRRRAHGHHARRGARGARCRLAARAHGRPRTRSPPWWFPLLASRPRTSPARRGRWTAVLCRRSSSAVRAFRRLCRLR